MCGINGMLIRECKSESKSESNTVSRNEFYNAASKISHRGPDRSSCISLGSPVNVMLDFERLAIMDWTTTGDQPFKYEYKDGQKDRTVYTMCNGEIYNHHEICEEFDLHPVSGSDCEVIPLMYEKFGSKSIELMCKKFNSEHAFMILDIDMNTGDYTMYLSTDRFGMRPLFVAWDERGFYFSSELQGLPKSCLESDSTHFERFKPRHYAIIEKKDGVLGNLSYHSYYDVQPKAIEHYDLEKCLAGVREKLEQAVTLRVESDRPYGCLLSGGLDSSIVSAFLSKYLKKHGKVLRTFSIGMPGGVDEKYAKMVAEYIESDHTHIEVSEQDFLDALPEVVKTLGSFDITTVRASTGQYLVSKWISEHTDIKVLACGDFSDEEMGSYLYFQNAPSPEDFHNECVRLLEDIHLYDGLRADRCISHFGIEARFPFADYNLIDFVLRVDPKLRMAKDCSEGNKMEKWLLRKSLDGLNLLPDEVLWRQKCAFSDAVSSTERSWYEIIQENADKMYTDDELDKAQKQFTHLPPYSKESLYFRNLFCETFGKNESVAKTIPYIWLPKWSGDITEPSARVLDMCKG
jgi:asparagine synthase (glutamine-hydrolysing)